MPYTLITSFVVLGGMLAVPILWDVALVAQGEETISEMTRRMGHDWSPIFIYAFSVLPGHWWVNFEKGLADYIGAGPVFEVFIVLWIGWGLHWTAVTNEWQLTPLQSLALIFFSVLVGAFCWTMQPLH